MKSGKRVAQNRLYYQLDPKPTPAEMREFYQEHYYQELHGVYQVSYDTSETKYIRDNLTRLRKCIERLSYQEFRDISFLDIGCGEGWAMQYFHDLGCNIRGVDLSSFALERFHPNLLDYFVQDDIYDFISKEVQSERKCDIVYLANVIEHVLEPEDLLLRLKSLLHDKSILIVTFPNDFSALQDLLVRLGKTEDGYWIAAPDHVSYFNKQSFEDLSNHLGFRVNLMLAEFPIDVFLLNDHSNYSKDKSRGKEAHRARIECMNLLSDLDVEKSLDAFLKFGELGFGRDLTAFLQLRK